MKKEVRITVEGPDGIRDVFWAYQGNTLSSVLELNGWKRTEERMDDDSCWKVRVIGNAAALSIEESCLLKADERENGIRRADLYRVEEPIQVVLHEGFQKDGLWGELHWEELGQEIPWHYRDLYLPGRPLHLPDVFQEGSEVLFDRMAAALSDCTIRFDMQELKEMAFLDRPGRPVIELKALVNVPKQEVYSITRREHPITGLLISLEAETVTLLAFDLRSGKKLAQHTEESILYHKLTAAANRRRERQPGQDATFAELHQAIREQIQRIMDEILAQYDTIRPRDIYRTVVIGQTALLHILLSVPPMDAAEGGLHSLFYQEMQLCPQGQVPEMNPWGEYRVLQQWGHMVGSDALAACMALGDCTQEPILLLQPTLGGFMALKIGERIWAEEAYGGIVPSAERLRNSMEGLLRMAGCPLGRLRRVYVCVPVSGKLEVIREKMQLVLQQAAQRAVYVLSPHFIGGQMALLSDEYREKLRKMKETTCFLR